MSVFRVSRVTTNFSFESIDEPFHPLQEESSVKGFSISEAISDKDTLTDSQRINIFSAMLALMNLSGRSLSSLVLVSIADSVDFTRDIRLAKTA
jgi:hypothetical protein